MGVWAVVAVGVEVLGRNALTGRTLVGVLEVEGWDLEVQVPEAGVELSLQEQLQAEEPLEEVAAAALNGTLQVLLLVEVVVQVVAGAAEMSHEGQPLQAPLVVAVEARMEACEVLQLQLLGMAWQLPLPGVVALQVLAVNVAARFQVSLLTASAGQPPVEATLSEHEMTRLALELKLMLCAWAVRFQTFRSLWRVPQRVVAVEVVGRLV